MCSPYIIQYGCKLTFTLDRHEKNDELLACKHWQQKNDERKSHEQGRKEEKIFFVAIPKFKTDTIE